MSDAIVLRALQLREHRILELEDENRRLKARAEAAERDRDALVSECNDWQASYGYALARAEAAERDRDLYMDAWREEKQQRIDTEAALARVRELRDEYKRDDNEHLNMFGQHHPV